MLCGDNEPDNPGPNPSSSFLSGHANVRGLNIADKFDELVSIIWNRNFILLVSLKHG